ECDRCVESSAITRGGAVCGVCSSGLACGGLRRGAVSSVGRRCLLLLRDSSRLSMWRAIRRWVDFLPRLKAGDSRPHGLGFLLHSRPHPGGPGMSYVSSTGRHRSTSGQDVLGGVYVPV